VVVVLEVACSVFLRGKGLPWLAVTNQGGYKKVTLEVTIMQYYSSTEGSPLDALILACSETVKAIAWKFARSSDGRVDADDLYSIGMVEVCEAASRAVDADNPTVYLCKAARYAMIGEWRRVYRWSIASLDAPLSDESSLTLMDVLPAPTSEVSVPSRRTRALNGAMRRLVSSRQRAALRRRYGLPGYGMHTMKETARNLHTTVPVVDHASRRGLGKLANDARLCKVMGVEVEQ